MPSILVMIFHSKSLATMVASRAGSGSLNSLRNSVANSFFSAGVMASLLAVYRQITSPSSGIPPTSSVFVNASAMPTGTGRCDTHCRITIVPRLNSPEPPGCSTGGRPINRQALGGSGAVAALGLEPGLLAPRKTLYILAEAKHDQRRHQDREQQVVIRQAQGSDGRRQRHCRAHRGQRHDSEKR